MVFRSLLHTIYETNSLPAEILAKLTAGTRRLWLRTCNPKLYNDAHRHIYWSDGSTQVKLILLPFPQRKKGFNVTFYSHSSNMIGSKDFQTNDNPKLNGQHKKISSLPFRESH